MEKIVAIDANEISPIMKNFGLEGLIATAKRGDFFFTAMILSWSCGAQGFLKQRTARFSEIGFETRETHLRVTHLTSESLKLTTY
jgi:hypothetical protein